LCKRAGVHGQLVRGCGDFGVGGGEEVISKRYIEHQTKEDQLDENKNIFYWTGHPFVDAGLSSLLLLSGKERPEDIKDEDVNNAIKFAAKIYSEKTWSANYLHGMIFPNSGILMANPGIKGIISKAIKNILKKEMSISTESLDILKEMLIKNFDEMLAKDVIEYLKQLKDTRYKTLLSEEDIRDIGSEIIKQKFVNEAIKRKIERELYRLYEDIKNQKKEYVEISEGTCVICGRYPPYHKVPTYMSSFPLLGSGKKANYFHSGNLRGADICVHCLFLVQFMPLASYKIGRVLIIQGYPYELNLELSKEAIQDVRIHRSASNARNFKRTENFLFRKIIEITQKVVGGYNYWRRASISLYYFISNNQGQVIDIINIPNPSLIFVAFASSYDPQGWKNLVSTGWRKKLSTDEEFLNFEREKTNEVYTKLLHNESVLSHFINLKNRDANTKWELLEFYCKEVLGMDEKALELIKNVGDRIVETLDTLEENKLTRRLRELENATKLYQFEEFFVNLEKLRQRMKIERPLMSFDEFSSLLVNYGENLDISWRTVKNLLLFRIYEKLHDKLSKISEKEETNEGGDEE